MSDYVSIMNPWILYQRAMCDMFLGFASLTLSEFGFGGSWLEIRSCLFAVQTGLAASQALDLRLDLKLILEVLEV